MTRNSRMMLGALAVLAVAAGLWLLLVSPARDDAATAASERETADTQATQVVGKLTSARAAAGRAADNKATLRRLDVAVPEKVEAAALVSQLDRSAARREVSFDVIKITDSAASAAPAGVAADGTAASGGATTSTTPSTSTSTTPATTTGAAPATPAAGTAAPAAPAGSVPVSLTVQVSGSYGNVTKYVRTVQGAVRSGGTSGLVARGRLMRIDGVALTLGDDGGLSGTLTIVAYLLPPATTTPAATGAAATTPTTGATP